MRLPHAVLDDLRAGKPGISGAEFQALSDAMARGNIEDPKGAQDLLQLHLSPEGRAALEQAAITGEAVKNPAPSVVLPDSPALRTFLDATVRGATLGAVDPARPMQTTGSAKLDRYLKGAEAARELEAAGHPLADLGGQIAGSFLPYAASLKLLRGVREAAGLAPTTANAERYAEGIARIQQDFLRPGSAISRFEADAAKAKLGRDLMTSGDIIREGAQTGAALEFARKPPGADEMTTGQELKARAAQAGMGVATGVLMDAGVLAIGDLAQYMKNAWFQRAIAKEAKSAGFDTPEEYVANLGEFEQTPDGVVFKPKMNVLDKLPEPTETVETPGARGADALTPGPSPGGRGENAPPAKTARDILAEAEERERLGRASSSASVRQDLFNQAASLRKEAEALATGGQAKLSPAERMQRARRIDPERDDLVTAIRKLGGIDTEADTYWAGRLSHLPRQGFGLPSIERPGKGRTIEDLSEPLWELGYLRAHDGQELHALLDQAETGKPLWSLHRNQFDDVVDDGARPSDRDWHFQPSRVEVDEDGSIVPVRHAMEAEQDFTVAGEHGEAVPARSLTREDFERLIEEERHADEWFRREADGGPESHTGPVEQRGGLRLDGTEGLPARAGDPFEGRAGDQSEAGAAGGAARVSQAGAEKPPAGNRLQFSGREFGYTLSIKDLVDRARAFARQNFAGKTVTVGADGSQVLIPWRGIKHTFSGQVSEAAAVVARKLDQLIEQGMPAGSAPDHSGRAEIKAAHFYDTPVRIGDTDATIRIVVRENPDGKRFYDHYELREAQPGGMSGDGLNDASIRPHRAAPAETSPANTTIAGIPPNGVRQHGPSPAPLQREIPPVAAADVAPSAGASVSPEALTPGPSPEGRGGAETLYQRRVRHAQTDTVPSGITHVRSAADAAHVVAPFRKGAQEDVLAVVADGDGQVLAVHRVHKGGKMGASVEPGTVAAAVANTPGAKRVWLAHNHPSGDVAQTPDDLAFSGQVHDLLRGSGVDLDGMIVVGPGGKHYSVYTPGGETTARARTGQVPVLERRLIGRTSQAEPVTSTDKLAKAFDDFPDESGVLIMDGQARPVGFVPLSADDMLKLRQGEGGPSARLLKALDETNGSLLAARIKGADEATRTAAGKNLAAFARKFGGDLWDVLDGAGASHVGNHGDFPSGGTFYANPFHFAAREIARDLKLPLGRQALQMFPGAVAGATSSDDEVGSAKWWLDVAAGAVLSKGAFTAGRVGNLYGKNSAATKLLEQFGKAWHYPRRIAAASLSAAASCPAPSGQSSASPPRSPWTVAPDCYGIPPASAFRPRPGASGRLAARRVRNVR